MTATTPPGSSGGRWTDRLLAEGDDPDPRFTMANERTFLAWIRTSLALVAAGLAVFELLDSQPRLERLLISLPLVAVGLVTALNSYGRWWNVERALRTSSPLPYSAFSSVVAVSIGFIAAVTLVVLSVQ